MSTTLEDPSGAISKRRARILDAMVDAPLAWSFPDDLAQATGLDGEALIDELADMDVEGLIDVWERPEGLAVTLSVLAADRFGYHLIESGPYATPRWARAEEPGPGPPRATQVLRSASTSLFSGMIDPHPGPELAAELNEQADRYRANGRFGTFRRGAGRGEPPRPTLLLGTNLNAWSEARGGDSPTCPACHSRPLPAFAYCLCCDRWGLEAPNPVSTPRRASWGGATRNPSTARFDPGAHDPRRGPAHRAPLIRHRKEHDRRGRLAGRDARRNHTESPG
ncbi:hypothetical protein AB1L88_06215 [Tautonia sp. JC769]|uniref:hypothetical protein n=1 Tax=Tautonia sp. JC769 TaxID=3232135 RepID=UPI003459FFE6